MQYITQNSDRSCIGEEQQGSFFKRKTGQQDALCDRHTQSSVSLKANHPTLLHLFTNINSFFSLTKLKKAYVYLFKKLLTISYAKAFVVYFSRDKMQYFIPI